MKQTESQQTYAAGSVRCYLTFIATAQKIVQFTLMPLIAIAGAAGMIVLESVTEIAAAIPDAGLNAVISIYLMYIFVICDVLYERNNFGGTFSSRASWIEYMKTSPSGMPFYKKVLQGGMCTRFLYALGTMGLFYVIRIPFTDVPVTGVTALWLFFAGAAWLAMQTGALFVRLFAAENVSAVIGMISASLLSALFVGMSVFAAESRNTVYVIAGVLTIALGTLLAVIMVSIGIKKKENEYADV